MGIVMNENVYMPDTTVFTKGTLKKALEEGIINNGKILIHVTLASHFEYLARKGVSQGFAGIKELKAVLELCKEGHVEAELTRDLPALYRFLPDPSKSPDEMLRLLALEWGITYVTSDKISREAAEALGVDVLFLEGESQPELTLAKFFDENTMSVHLKENVAPYAKKGRPGHWVFEKIREEPLTRLELEEMVREIVESARSAANAFIEIDRPGSTIVQVGNYRIVITKPPFSDGIEITAVRPVAKLSLEDYNLPPKLVKRLEEKAEGILIAGAPGMGKTTFAQALAEYYYRKGKIVKTLESPRDMHLPDEITQYSKNYATSEEIHDALLLSRPDYTVFDEMRDTKDFELYTDLRLAGVGMVGVVHATSPIDAIQRFVGRVELGMIPSIIDTVIFIENGGVKKVYELETTVKIPHGLREADLARPVVVVKDFLTGSPEYEIYVFGERTFVVPIKKQEKPRDFKIRISLERFLRKYIPDESVEIKLTEDGRAIILVDTEYYNYLLGKPRRKLERIGKKLGVEIELRPKF